MQLSSFNGNINEIPGISLDNFTNKNARAYFLSHSHTDHTAGLYDNDFASCLKRKNAYIYMSTTLAAIIRYEFECRNTDFNEIKQYIKPLDIGRTSITLPPDAARGLQELHVSVTLIPAGHSVGSVMFLFRTCDKTVLFTGDFRISYNDVSKYGQLHDRESGEPLAIDALYVDTTFIHLAYKHFPKRSDTVRALVFEVDKWLKMSERNRVAVHTSAKIGYEFVYNELYKQLRLKIQVENEIWTKLYSTMQHAVPGVTNTVSHIHLCRNRSENKSHDLCNIPNSSDYNYLYIHLSAMIWSNYDMEDNCIRKISDKRINACFSTHCSRSELLYFVNYLTPKKIVGFPNVYNQDSPKKTFKDTFEVTPKKRKLNEVDKKIDVIKMNL